MSIAFPEYRVGSVQRQFPAPLREGIPSPDTLLARFILRVEAIAPLRSALSEELRRSSVLPEEQARIAELQRKIYGFWD